MSWDLVQRSKDVGGLEVGNLEMKNAALLSKWWWKYSGDDCPLWKKVICSVHGFHSNIPINAQHSKLGGSVWTQIYNFPKANSEVANVINLGL